MILAGDSRETLARMDTKSVDAILTDPPYGLNDGRSERMVGIYKDQRWKAFAESWDTELPLWWIPEAARLLVPGGAVVAFTDMREVGTVWRAYEAAGITPLRIGAWVKTNPPTNPRKNFRSGLEGWVFGRVKGKVRHWAGGGVSLNYWTGPRPQGRERIHKTQKPVDLMRWMAERVVPPGGLCLDPFAGAGTTGEAVLGLGEGRKFLGIEQDEDMAQKAQARLDAARRTPLEQYQHELAEEMGQLFLWTAGELQ